MKDVENKSTRAEGISKEDIFDCVIIGTGIVGLAVAYEYQCNYPNEKLLILEKEPHIFEHQSGRNSGVIHSGIYYKPGTLKAKNCIDGYKRMISFANKHSIKYEITGKLIIAIEESQKKALKTLFSYGKQNGLKGLKILDSKKEIQKIEPYCTNAIQALYVPQAGIIDYKEVGLKLVELLKKGSAEFRFNTLVKKVENKDNIVNIKTCIDQIFTRKAIVCSGVYSDRFILSSLKKKVRIFPFRGEYYQLKPSATNKVKGLIYPSPDLNFPFLGVHFTKTIQQGVEAGPNAVLAFSREGYNKSSFKFKDFSQILSWKGFWIFALKFWKIGIYETYRSFSKRAFTRSLQTLIPSITMDDLEPTNPGIRAQVLSNDGDLLDDFLIDQNKGITNIINAPSPAATSSFAIAKDVITKINNNI